ncbi:PRSS12 [Mytilus edulis]|uniref:PRSS12 n=1 Tax=Mytilus edulis TaxID=6550 RepID=A0A8S3SM75_MYTED|nr:PRSS12 [Mytilus edulis]
MQSATMIDDGIGAIWLNEVNCTGSESKLLECAYNADSLHCSHHGDVGIHCFLSCLTKDEGGLRIISGLTANQGRLEIYRYGEWGTVCDYHFDNNDAEVACRQLGFCSGIMQPAHMIDDGIGAIWLNEVNCTGAESTLLQCAYNADSLHCSHHEDVGIHCFLSCSTKDEGDLRITEGFAQNQGRLEIKYKGEWGTVCDNQFANVDAEVACRQL